MKKLAILCGSLSRGGAERVTVRLARYMTAQGIETLVINEYTYIEKEEYELDADVERVLLHERPRSIHEPQRITEIPGRISRLRRVLKEKQVDTVLIMSSGICFYAIPGAFGHGRKIIVSERNDPKRNVGKKSVRFLAHFFMRLADGFVFQTEEARDFYRQRGYKEGAVIPNPLPSEDLPVYEGKREKLIVTAGRLEPQKNTALLIEAFSRIAPQYPEYRLMIYGEGRLRERLQGQIGALHLEKRVCLAGNVPDVLERIKSAGLFVMSSDFEGMPNALIEAMALGLPCISTDCPCGGPRELIEDGVNGLLVPVGDAAATAEAMDRLLGDPEQARRLGKKAMEIREKLNIDRIGKQWMEYLSSV